MTPTGFKFRDSNHSSLTDIAFTQPTTNTWTHYSIIYNKGSWQVYQNDNLITTQTYNNATLLSVTTLDLRLGRRETSSGSAYFSGKINDFRLYDHALSAKEVKEISKALVLHYKLDGPKEAIPVAAGPENLLISTGFSQTDINNMVGNSSTDWTKYLRWYNGSKAIHSFADGIDTIRLNATGNLGIAFIRKATDINLDPNSYYILSCEAKCTKSGAKLGIGTSYYTTGNAWVWRGGANKFDFNAVDTWQTFTYKFKPDSNTQYISYCFTCNNGTSGGTDTFSIRHCKLEKGQTATAWTLNKEDDGYLDSLILDDIWTKEYDCSGYGYNTTITGTPTIDTTSARFSQATHMNNRSTANHMECSTITIPTDSISVSFWVKATKTVGQVLFAYSNIIEFGILNQLGYVNPATSSAGFNLSNFTTDAWNHIVVIRSGTNYSLYVNGVAAARNGANNNYVHNNSKLYLFNRSYNNNYAADASISDFRIYTTILSEADIFDLYNTSAAIDKNGNGYAREEIEDAQLTIMKNGQFHNNELIDDDTNITASITKTDKQLKVNTFYEY